MLTVCAMSTRTLGYDGAEAAAPGTTARVAQRLLLLHYQGPLVAYKAPPLNSKSRPARDRGGYTAEKPTDKAAAAQRGDS